MCSPFSASLSLNKRRAREVYAMAVSAFSGVCGWILSAASALFRQSGVRRASHSSFRDCGVPSGKTGW